MDEIPPNIMFDIFSRCPVKYLLRFRCVSKVWCKYIDDSYLAIIHGKRVIEEPTPIMFHLNPPPGNPTRSLCFHTIDHQSSATNTLVMKPKKVPDFEFLCKEPPSRSSINNIKFLGSCNGLIYVSESDGDYVTTLSVIQPIKKQCYKLPPLPFRFSRSMTRESCGLCFDSSTNTLKMVCVLLKGHPPSKNTEEVRKKLYTMVHVLGTDDSWHEIPQVSSYPVQGEAIFANGCLHWLVSYFDSPKSPSKDERYVVWFDVKKEEFGSINPPKTTSNRPNREYGTWIHDHLVNLNGQVGYFCDKKTEVWVLNHKKEWVLHCQIGNQELPRGYMKVIGCVNKDGDILIKFIKHDAGKVLFLVYNLKNSVLHKSRIVGRGEGYKTDIVMFPNSLFSFHNIITNSRSVKKYCGHKRCCG